MTPELLAEESVGNSPAISKAPSNFSRRRERSVADPTSSTRMDSMGWTLADGNGDVRDFPSPQNPQRDVPAHAVPNQEVQQVLW